MQKCKPLIYQVTVIFLLQIYLRVSLLHAPVVGPVYKSVRLELLHVLVRTARVCIQRPSLSI